MKMARTAASRCGFAFDVDGVLVRGPQVLSRATAALQLLRDRGVPLCFVTNGGGTTEEWRAKTLTKRLELPVSADEVCLCHTPMQPRIDQILREDDGALLVVGRKEQQVRELAASYGIPSARAFTPSDLHVMLPLPGTALSRLQLLMCEEVANPLRKVPWPPILIRGGEI